MKFTAPGFVATPTPLASAMLSISVLALPPPNRDRYREEFRTELCALSTARQIAEAAGIMLCAPTLRRALKEDEMSISPRPAKHLTCRIGRHHYLLIDDENPEDRRIHHLECRDCGKIKDPREYSRTDGSWMARGNLGG